eukprot:scaffold291442_cov22-Tisochrysis_lutea.AAC.1
MGVTEDQDAAARIALKLKPCTLHLVSPYSCPGAACSHADLFFIYRQTGMKQVCDLCFMALRAH